MVYQPERKEAMKISFGIIIGFTIVMFCIIPYSYWDADKMIFSAIVFSISNGMFLYENWYKQKCAIRKIKSLLPDEYYWQHIEYNAIGKKYTIQGDYQGKVFIIKVDVLSQE